MTNFSRLSVSNCVCAVLLVLAGCGPKDGKKEYEQGKEAYELRDLPKAAKLFEESLACAPENVDRLMYLARVKLDLGELPAAKDLVGRAALLAEDDVDVRMLSAQIAWHMKDYAAAAAIFTALAEDNQLEPGIRSQAYAGLGVVETTCDNYHLARIAYLRAIRLNRRNAAAWYHLGFLYRDSFAYLEAALEQFEIYVRLEEEASPRVQKIQKTTIPELKEQIAHVATERPGVAKRNSAASSAALAKAESEMKKGLFKAARQSYQTALDADPLSYPAALGLARAWEKTDSSKAFDYYRTACTLNPSAVKTFITTGALAVKLGYQSQAVEIYSRAVAASPMSYDAIDGLIRALRKVGGDKNRAAAQAYQLYRESITKPRR